MNKKIIIIIGISIFVLISFISIIIIFKPFSNKLVCKSKHGNITLIYNKKNITGYSAKNMTYKLDEQNKIAHQIGIEEYMKQFNEWFKNTTSGSCLYK